MWKKGVRIFGSLVSQPKPAFSSLEVGVAFLPAYIPTAEHMLRAKGNTTAASGLLTIAKSCTACSTCAAVLMRSSVRR